MKKLQKVNTVVITDQTDKSKLHHCNSLSEELVDEARTEIAKGINCDESEIIFTSGATEYNNIAIKGVAHFYKDQRNHIITVSTEHKCVLDACRHLEDEGFKVTYLPVSTTGLIDLQQLEDAITDQTLLVSVMAINNEIGTIQPLKEITNLLDTNVKTGFGRETLTNAKKILGQDVSNEEQFQAMVGAEAMKNIALTKGAISDREMDYFKTVLSPNQGKSTEGNKKIIEFRIKYAERANKISKTISDLQAQEKNPFEIKKAVDEIISSESLLDNASPEKTEINQAAEDATFLGGY